MISILRSAVSSLRYSSVLLACLVVLASHSPASAQMYEDVIIESQSKTMGGTTVYQIKGVATATKIPAGMMSVWFTFEFMSTTTGEYKTQFTIKGSKEPPGIGGSVTYDTGFRCSRLKKAKSGELW